MLTCIFFAGCLDMCTSCFSSLPSFLDSSWIHQYQLYIWETNFFLELFFLDFHSFHVIHFVEVEKRLCNGLCLFYRATYFPQQLGVNRIPVHFPSRPAHQIHSRKFQLFYFVNSTP
jgi:hypothetical protein